MDHQLQKYFEEKNYQQADTVINLSSLFLANPNFDSQIFNDVKLDNTIQSFLQNEEAIAYLLNSTNIDRD